MNALRADVVRLRIEARARYQHAVLSGLGTDGRTRWANFDDAYRIVLDLIDQRAEKKLEPAMDRVRYAFTEWQELTLPLLSERISAEIERLREAGQ